MQKEEKTIIRLEDVIEHLKNGLTREEIGNLYNLSKKDVKELFKHPDLKGKKTRKVYEPSFKLVTSDEDNTLEEKEETNSETEDKVVNNQATVLTSDEDNHENDVEVDNKPIW